MVRSKRSHGDCFGYGLLTTDYGPKSGQCVSAAKQHPDRPGIAPALGLRAGEDASILSQTDHQKECNHAPYTYPSERSPE